MSVKNKVIALAASLMVAGGAGAGALVTAGSAAAATPSCGSSCLEVYNKNIGKRFVLDVYKRGQKVGQPVILFRASNSDPAEDFTVSEQGTVNDFYQAGLVSSALALHYGCVTGVNSANCQFPNLAAYEVEYAPYGADTGLCVGVTATASNSTKVALEPCGVSSKTVWIADYADSTPFSRSVPLINGSDTNFSQPYVLTYPSTAFPTDNPRPQLYTHTLTGFSNGHGPTLGTVDDNQLYSFKQGVLR